MADEITQLNVRISAELKGKIDAATERYDMTQREFLTDVIEKHFDQASVFESLGRNIRRSLRENHEYLAEELSGSLESIVQSLREISSAVEKNRAILRQLNSTSSKSDDTFDW